MALWTEHGYYLRSPCLMLCRDLAHLDHPGAPHTDPYDVGLDPPTSFETPGATHLERSHPPVTLAMSIIGTAPRVDKYNGPDGCRCMEDRVRLFDKISGHQP